MDNFFVIEKGDSNYTIAAWLGWVPMVAGSIGCLAGGLISDKLAATPSNYELFRFCCYLLLITITVLTVTCGVL